MPGFKRGDLIYSSKPYVYVLSNSERGKRCDSCFLKNDNLKRCSQCSFLYFCNTECQRESWDIHKSECKFIMKSSPNIPTQSLRLVSQIIIKIKKYGVDNPCEEVFNRKMSFRLLQSHATEIKQNLKACQLMIGMIGTLKDYIGSENVPPPVEFIEIFGKMCINAFSICDSKMESIGTGLYLGASIFDHSCEPDAEVIFDGIKICIRAICDVPTSDISKIFISYIDQLQLTQERQDYLREHYYFNCNCTRCTSSDFDDLVTKTLVSAGDAKEVVTQSEKAIKDLKKMKKKKALPSIIYETCMKVLQDQEGVLDDHHILKTKVFEIAFDACIHLNQWKEAIAIGDQITLSYRLCYGPFHPNLGIHLFKMGKIQKFLAVFDLSEKHLLQVSLLGAPRETVPELLMSQPCAPISSAFPHLSCVHRPSLKSF